MYFFRGLLKASKNDNFIQVQDWIKRIYLTVAHNEHFWIIKSWITSCFLRIKVDSKWSISQILKIILEQNYLSIVEGIGNAFPCSANLKMFFHVFIILGKRIFTLVTLLNGTMTNNFFSFLKHTYVASIGKMNFGRWKNKEQEPFPHKLAHKQYLWQ